MNRTALPLYCALIAALGLPALSRADETSVRQGMQARFPYAQIERVIRLPYDHLYEVDFTDHLVYTDEALDFMLSGELYDLHTMQNLTQAREKQRSGQPFAGLPLQLALREVHGRGQRQLVVFTDPNCPYCKRLAHELARLDNVTIYTFVLSILPGSEQEAKKIWCAPDRLQAWQAHMLDNAEPHDNGHCDTRALDQMAALAQKLDIRMTPTLYFPDGSTHPGFMTRSRIDAALATTTR